MKKLQLGQNVGAYIHAYIHTDIHTDIQRQTDRQTGMHTYRQADRRPYLHTYRRTYIIIYDADAFLSSLQPSVSSFPFPKVRNPDAKSLK